ncbi:MAG TPA: T9SS type A sorting domain-containing protein [Edaphocola sp.]|nr:T9SS type A sorting domain-containing protein [Edaphocola sp.]
MEFNCNNKEGDRNSQNMLPTCGVLKQYQESSDHLNYFLPHCGANGITNVKGYARIVYEDVFDNINVHMYSNSKGPKILFEINPGGNPADIQLLFTGQDSIAVTNNGLAMYLEAWEMTLPQAYAYEIDIANNTNLLSWLPVWNHSGAGNVTILTNTYDTSKTLVIGIGDTPGTPLAIQNLDWSVYYGDDGEQRDSRIAADDSSIYHGMTQLALSFYAYNGQYNNIDLLPNLGDWCISKFTNTERKWSTYYGGTHRDNLTDIKTFSNSGAEHIGGIWVSGYTTSNNVIDGPIIPFGCFKQGFNAGNGGTQRDGLLASFDKGNGELKYNTYYGSKADEYISRIGIDEENQMLYIAGTTYGTASAFVNNCAAQTNGDFPLCSGMGQYFKDSKNMPNASDGFIAQFRMKNMELLWATLFGGEDHEEITYILPHEGKLLLGGLTNSHNFDEFPSPTTSHSIDQFPLAEMAGAFFQNSTVSAYQMNNFITAFNENKELVWSTLLGQGLGISGLDFDSKNNLYVLAIGINPGHFASSSNVGNSNGLVPTYDNGIGYYETISSNHQRGAVLKFDKDFNLTWGTKLHSLHSFGFTWHEPTNYRSGLTVDEKDRLFIFTSLDTVSNNTFTVNIGGAYWQPTNSATGINTAVGSVFDNFIYGFDNNDQLKWATFFGGVGNSFGSFDIAQGIVSQDKYIYVTGMTACPGSPYNQCPYPNSYCDQTYNYGLDAFISRFDVSSMPVVGIKNKNKPSLAGISAFPNPSVNGVFTINFVNSEALNIGINLSIQIINQTGQVLAKDKLKILDGPNSFQLDLSQMPTGVYYLHLSANDYSGDIKLIKN